MPDELHNRLRGFVVIENREVALVQIAYELPVPVGGNE